MQSIRSLIPILALFAGPAWAGSFTVSPVRIEIPMPRKAAAVEVENTGTQGAQIQAERFLWKRGAGDEGLVPTADYIVTPPIVTLQPGQRQILRVMFLSPLDPRREASYRLILQETPLNDPAPNTVATVLRLSLPVFVTPPGAKSDLAWSSEESGGVRRLVAHNRGLAHAFINEVRTPEGGKLAPSGYLLPGERREWTIDGVAPEHVVVLLRDGSEYTAAVAR